MSKRHRIPLSVRDWRICAANPESASQIPWGRGGGTGQCTANPTPQIQNAGRANLTPPTPPNRWRRGRTPGNPSPVPAPEGIVPATPCWRWPSRSLIEVAVAVEEGPASRTGRLREHQNTKNTKAQPPAQLSPQTSRTPKSKTQLSPQAPPKHLENVQNARRRCVRPKE